MRLLLLLLFLFPTSAFAIINIEDLDLSLNEDGQKGRVGLAVKGASGNTTKIGAEADGRFILRRGPHLNMLIGSISYGKSNGRKDTNKAFVHARHRHMLNATWSLELFSQAQKDEFARLKLRALLGGGGRYSFKRDGTTIHFGLGSFYEHEKLKPGAAAVLSSNIWRANAYMAWHYAINDRVRLQNTVYYQPAWKDFGDNRISDAAALRIAINESIDLRLAIDVAHDSRPPIGVKPTDISYTTGLEFRF